MTRARQGFSILEVVIAIAVLVTALVPLIEAMRSGAATVRPRELDLIASNLANSLLERLAAPPVMFDSLRRRFQDGAQLGVAEVTTLVRHLHGELPGSIKDRLEQADIALELTRADRLVGRDSSGNIETGLETWTVKLTWKQDGRTTTRTFTRVTAQG